MQERSSWFLAFGCLARARVVWSCTSARSCAVEGWKGVVSDFCSAVIDNSRSYYSCSADFAGQGKFTAVLHRKRSNTLL